MRTPTEQTHGAEESRAADSADVDELAGDAPDDELTEDEEQALAESIAEIERGELFTLEEVLREMREVSRSS